MRVTLIQLFFGLLLAFLPGLARAACSVELNSASLAQLQTLPGIGPAKAAAIVDYRTQAGPFATVEALDNVPGIGPATMANLRPLVCVGAEGGAAPAEAAASSSSSASSSSASAPSAGGQVDINTATAAQLDQLPGIGPAKAAAILADRQEKGPFASCNDLGRVTGIGDATIANLAASCTASPTSGN
jgi:competence protein ComEA